MLTPEQFSAQGAEHTRRHLASLVQSPQFLEWAMENKLVVERPARSDEDEDDLGSENESEEDAYERPERGAHAMSQSGWDVGDSNDEEEYSFDGDLGRSYGHHHNEY